jgi:hypothetical protein
MINVEKIPKQRQSVRFTILLKLYEYQQNTNNGKPIFIEHFNRIVKDHRDGNVVTSPELFLKLICSDNVGCAIKLERHVDIISPCLNKVTDLDAVLEIFSDNLNRYITTIEYNLSTKRDKLVERMLRNTRIPIDKQVKVKAEINIISKGSLSQIKATFAKYEANVEDGTYPAIGVHLYQFFQQHEVNHEKNSSANSIVSIVNVNAGTEEGGTGVNSSEPIFYCISADEAGTGIAASDEAGTGISSVEETGTGVSSSDETENTISCVIVN